MTTVPAVDAAPDKAVHRFLVRASDAGYVGYVDGGHLLEWIDRVAFETATRWSQSYCVTAYVGNLHLDRPISVGDVVELHADVVHTGTSSMHILVTVYASDPSSARPQQSAQCLTIFVAVDDSGTPRSVPVWSPTSMLDQQRNRRARSRIGVRKQIEAELASVDYGDAADVTLRFMATPNDVNWGGKVHGGRIMRWIDEAGYVCGSRWAAGPVIASYFAGIRFYRPVQIGQVIEVSARLLYTGPYSLHLGVHVSAVDPAHVESSPAAHAVAVFVGYGPDGKRAVPSWTPASDADRALHEHAQRLVALRAQAEPFS